MKFNLAEFAKGYLATQVGMQQGKQQQELLAQEQQRQMFAQNLQTQQLELQKREVDQRGDLAKQQFEQNKLEAQAQSQYRTDSLKLGTDELTFKRNSFDTAQKEQELANARIDPALTTRALDILKDINLNEVEARAQVAALAESITTPDAKQRFLDRFSKLPRNTELPLLQSRADVALKTLPALFGDDPKITELFVNLTEARAGVDKEGIRSALDKITARLPAAFMGRDSQVALKNTDTLIPTVKPKVRRELMGLKSELLLAQHSNDPTAVSKAQMALAERTRQISPSDFTSATPEQEQQIDTQLTTALASTYPSSEAAKSSIEAYYRRAVVAGTPGADDIGKMFFHQPGDTREQLAAKKAALELTARNLSKIENPGQKLTKLHGDAIELVRSAGVMDQKAYLAGVNTILRQVDDPRVKQGLQSILYTVTAGKAMEHDKELLRLRQQASSLSIADIGEAAKVATPIMNDSQSIIDKVNTSLGWQGDMLTQIVNAKLSGDVSRALQEGRLPTGVQIIPGTKDAPQRVVLSPSVDRQLRRWQQATDMKRLSTALLTSTDPIRIRQLLGELQQVSAIDEEQYPIGGLRALRGVERRPVGPPAPDPGNPGAGGPDPGAVGGTPQGRVPVSGATGDPINGFMGMARGTAEGIARAVAGADAKEATKGGGNLNDAAPPPRVKRAPKPAPPAPVAAPAAKPAAPTKAPVRVAPRSAAPAPAAPPQRRSEPKPVRRSEYLRTPAQTPTTVARYGEPKAPTMIADEARKLVPVYMKALRAAGAVSRPQAQAIAAAYSKGELQLRDAIAQLQRIAE